MSDFTEEKTQPVNFKNSLYKKAFFLSLFTIFYNIIEGIVSIYFGATDETLALFGFGVDSFVEVLSGLEPGEEVVTSANFLIDSESRLKAALSGAGAHAH